MSEIADIEGASVDEKPVQVNNVKFPRFPAPADEDFDEDISEEERNYYRSKFTDLDTVKTLKIHCSSCDRHLGSQSRNDSRMRAHPMLRTLVCHSCHTFYNSGEFEKGDDGSELYCRWCGQGGQVYCCSNCPHVFCAKCIRRNLGNPKIREIENTDDWKCFKCNPKCLWDLRAMCWALLRYCDLKNKLTYKTEDADLKELYQKDCATDYTECCKNKKRKEKQDTNMETRKSIKKEPDIIKKTAMSVMSKLPPTIQVKKFASILPDDNIKEKRGQKRPASPMKSKSPYMVKNPIAIAPCPTPMPSLVLPALKKIRMPINITPMKPYPLPEKKQAVQLTRVRPKPPSMPIMPASQYNGFGSNMFHNDNINLSLESLTQGLDMAAVAAMSGNNSSQDDDVVCTPDFPLEPLCEVTEDTGDDDVQCMTPAPAPKTRSLPDITSDNIVQMTDNDVTVNSVTGGLKFRVDPQTLSSNKMYRLPDGRIFAINANPNMPGGYSATIVAVTDSAHGKAVAPKGATYAAKLSAVTIPQPALATPRQTRNQNQKASSKAPEPTPRSVKAPNVASPPTRECDMHVAVEWYRYNLIDSIDTLEYSLSRLNKLKKQATTVFLRTRNVEEMRRLTTTLERLLNTSSSRFNEIRDNLNKELKYYVSKKMGEEISDEDDDVEILPNLDNDDPIFIDENSVDSNFIETQEVDLTGVGSSDHNDSTENIKQNDKSDDKPGSAKKDSNSHNSNDSTISTENLNNSDKAVDKETESKNELNSKENLLEDDDDKIDSDVQKDKNTSDVQKDSGDKSDSDIKNDIENKDTEDMTEKTVSKLEGDADKDNSSKMDVTDETNEVLDQSLESGESMTGKNDTEINSENVPQVNGDTVKENKLDDTKQNDDTLLHEKESSSVENTNSEGVVDKSQDAEMTDEMIEKLLKDDNDIEKVLENQPVSAIETV